MAVLLRYLIHDMLAQYRRTLLVLITLLLSSASIFASAAISDTMVALGTNQWRAENGYSDITITPTPASSSRFFSEFAATPYAGQFDYIVYKLSAAAQLDGASGPIGISAMGVNLQALRKMVPVQFSRQVNLFPFEGNKAVISKKAAEQLALSPGDVLTVQINGNRHAFVLCAIAYAQGPFAFEADTPVLLLPYQKLQACIGELGRVDTISAKLKDPGSKGRLMRELTDAYQGYRVSESYSEDHIRLQANRTAVPFAFMSVLLCFMAVYVLFTVFRGIVSGRWKLLGLFRAIGAYRRDTWAVILAESLLYGILGGMLSWAAGTGMLYAMIRGLNSGSSHQYITLALHPSHFLLAMGSSLLTSLSGALLCLLSQRKDSVCQQIKGLPEGDRQKRPGAVWGLALLAVPTAVVLLWQNENGLIHYIACVVCMLTAVMLLSPALYTWTAERLDRVFRHKGGLLRLALLNSKNRGGFVTCATILSIIVSTIVVISTVSFSNGEGLRQHYQRLKYDIELSANGLDRQAVNLVSQAKGVQAVCANLYSGTVEVAGQSIPLYRVQGVTAQHAGFLSYEIDSSWADPLGTLETGRNLLLTRIMQSIYRVKEGDRLALAIYGRDGKYREASYTVIGFFEDTHTKLGRYAWISQDNFREDFAAKGYDSLYIRAADATTGALTAAFGKQQVALQSVAQNRRDDEMESANIIGAMGLICNLAVATGVLGILNITLFSFLKRRREIGIYYALGMTAGDILKLMMAELLLCGLLGSVCGTLAGLLVAALALPRLIFSLQIALRIYPDIQAFGLGLPVGMLICAVSSGLCLPMLNRSNPISGLKREE